MKSKDRTLLYNKLGFIKLLYSITNPLKEDVTGKKIFKKGKELIASILMLIAILCLMVFIMVPAVLTLMVPLTPITAIFSLLALFVAPIIAGVTLITGFILGLSFVKISYEHNSVEERIDPKKAAKKAFEIERPRLFLLAKGHLANKDITQAQNIFFQILNELVSLEEYERAEECGIIIAKLFRNDGYFKSAAMTERLVQELCLFETTAWHLFVNTDQPLVKRRKPQSVEAAEAAKAACVRAQHDDEKQDCGFETEETQQHYQGQLTSLSLRVLGMRENSSRLNIDCEEKIEREKIVRPTV